MYYLSYDTISLVDSMALFPIHGGEATGEDNSLPSPTQDCLHISYIGQLHGVVVHLVSGHPTDVHQARRGSQALTCAF